MRKFLGYTFLELIVVIGLIGIVASFAMVSSKDTSKTYSLLAEAQTAGSRLSLVVAEAQSSQSTIRLVCDYKSLFAQYFRGQKSNTLNALTTSLGTLGASALTATSSTVPTKQIPLIDYTQQNKTLQLTCPSCGIFAYITSDGSLFNQCTLGQNTNYEIIFYSTQNTNIRSKLAISATGYPRIYLQDLSVSSLWNEIIN